MHLHHQARSMIHSSLHSFENTFSVSLALMFQFMAIYSFSILQVDFIDGRRVSEK